MDADLYDEFGNYVGPDLESDDDDDQSIYGQDAPIDPDVSSASTIDFKCKKNNQIVVNSGRPHGRRREWHGHR